MLTSQPPYPDKFKAGDIAIAKTHTEFMYGDKHEVGQEIVVTEETKSYYNVWHHLYDKLGNSPDIEVIPVPFDPVELTEEETKRLEEILAKPAPPLPTRRTKEG